MEVAKGLKAGTLNNKKKIFSLLNGGKNIQMKTATTANGI